MVIADTVKADCLRVSDTDEGSFDLLICSLHSTYIHCLHTHTRIQFIVFDAACSIHFTISYIWNSSNYQLNDDAEYENKFTTAAVMVAHRIRGVYC